MYINKSADSFYRLEPEKNKDTKVIDLYVQYYTPCSIICVIFSQLYVKVWQGKQELWLFCCKKETTATVISEKFLHSVALLASCTKHADM